MHKRALEVILAYKRKLVRVLKRQKPGIRIKARQYYRSHRAKLKLQRKRYLKKNKSFLKSRKLFKRTKPAWLVHKKTKQTKPKIMKPTIKKIRIKKFHAPKRNPKP